MSTYRRNNRFSLSPLIVSALTILLFAGSAQAQQSKKQQEQQKKELQHQAKQAQREQQKVVNQEMNVREGALLKEAYIYIAMANHNYDGHRGKAMGHVQDAAKLLDAQVLKNGTNGQKVLALQHDVKAYEAKFVAKLSAKEREPQALSDAQMAQALKLLSQVKPILVQRKQNRVLDKVDSAIAEVTKALAYRARGGR